MKKSKCLLPTYPSHYLLCSSFRHPSNVIRSITQSITLYTCPAIWLIIFVCPQCPKTWVSFSGKRARPCLLQILMAEFRQQPFFLLSSKGHDRGQRSEGLGLVAKEESTNKAKPPVLIGLCKQQIWVLEAWEQSSMGRLCYHNQKRSKCWWMTGCIEHATTHSFKAKMRSRELQWQEELLLLWSENISLMVHP